MHTLMNMGLLCYLKWPELHIYRVKNDLQTGEYMSIIPVIAMILQLQVSSGLDQLIASGFEPLKNKSIAVLTNHSAVDKNGLHLLEHLKNQDGIRIKAILSPEHGFYGDFDQENIPDSKHPETGVRIFSLYGDTRKMTAGMLKDVDLLLFDIQDIGVRFYTYQTTLLYAMEACAEFGIPFTVLDRPNPIGGNRFYGPSLDANRVSFTGAFPMPVIHGMTMGELAKMFHGEKAMKLQLDVILCGNWKRSMLFHETGLLWVNPSPNMRNLTQAILYPAIGLLERTNLSVGRGTDEPFERFGAPWIQPNSFARTLNSMGLKGVAFVPFFFTPSSGPYKDESCGGVHILLKDERVFDPIQVSYSIFRLLIRMYPTCYKPDKFISLLANQEAYEGCIGPSDLSVVRASERKYLKEFKKIRKAYLLYD